MFYYQINDLTVDLIDKKNCNSFLLNLNSISIDTLNFQKGTFIIQTTIYYVLQEVA